MKSEPGMYCDRCDRQIKNKAEATKCYICQTSLHNDCITENHCFKCKVDFDKLNQILNHPEFVDQEILNTKNSKAIKFAIPAFAGLIFCPLVLTIIHFAELPLLEPFLRRYLPWVFTCALVISVATPFILRNHKRQFQESQRQLNELQTTET